jgi:hypothetical protein
MVVAVVVDMAANASSPLRGADADGEHNSLGDSWTIG